MKKIIILVVLIALLTVFGVKAGYIKFAELKKLSFQTATTSTTPEKVVVVSEESVIIKVVKNAQPSVVTVSISTTQQNPDSIQFDPFNPTNPFNTIPGESRKIEQNIGSGFIVSEDGLIITNKHVVSDTTATYKVITQENKTYPAVQVFRDPLNDLAIIKVDARGLLPLPLGDSDKLQLGQLAIAFGTPLGEFRNTVTQGIVSGLGRGITAGSPFEGSVERLDNVIQTDAAISPGNSGGPLVSSAGQVIGINTAVSQEGQNIGFAIPVNVIKELINNYKSSGGKISRPFLGIRYKVLDKESAVLNDLPAGAYILEVVQGSSADSAGLQKGDVIVKIDGVQIGKEDDISNIVRTKKVGDRLALQIWRDKQTLQKDVVLGEAK
ncbi:MAG: trypsin-like peptidase domain-containing protein [Patescibacteria group bacterium]|jgi:S1-C subfamily serine protease